MPKKKKSLSKEVFKTRRVASIRTVDKVDRNDPCPCGSGKKYKKCCYHRKRSVFSRLADKVRG